MKRTFTTAFLCVLLLFHTIVYATNTDIDQTRKQAVVTEQISSKSNYHWEFFNDKWYYKDISGTITYGRFIDEFGDIYDTEGRADGSIIVSGSNSLGESFDKNGRLINTSMNNILKYKDMAIKYENGETLFFDSQKDFSMFIEYYTVQYRLSTYSGPYTLYCSGNTFTSTLSEDMKYNRAIVIEEILKKFGPVSGNSDFEKIVNACDKVKSIDYDTNYSNSDIITCLNANKGVCWHYAKIVSTLLDNAGIDNEKMVGTSQGTYHMWIRYKIDDKWFYIDPIKYKSYGSTYANINYEEYLKNYVTIYNPSSK
jgi:hypothetical protein